MLDLFFRLLLNTLDLFAGKSNLYGNPNRPIVYLDCETTGLDAYDDDPDLPRSWDTRVDRIRKLRHELLSLAMIVEVRGHVVYTMDSLVQPERIAVASAYALKMNEWCEFKWSDAPNKAAVCKELATLLRPTVDAFGRKLYPTVVAHNAAFDMEFLEAMWSESSTEPFPRIHRVMDTLAMSEGVIGSVGWRPDRHGGWASFPSNSMDNVRRHMGWSLEGAHTAKKDTEDLRNLYWYLVNAGPVRRFWTELCGRVRTWSPPKEEPQQGLD